MTRYPKLSIIILYYNSKHYLDQCLDSLAKSELHGHIIETIVVNNGAIDGIVARAEKKYKNNQIINPKFVYSATNLGFSAGNNLGIKSIHPRSKYVLFLNDDTVVFPDTIGNMIDLFDRQSKVDAATGYTILASTNQLAPESHRGFPTPWNTFWHFFGLGIPKIFPKLAILHGYLNDHKEYESIQTIDCCQGCFLMLRKEVGETIGWWNEKYFFLGEDLDLCFQLKKNNFRLYFYPKAKIIHYHGISSGLKDTKSLASRQSRLRSAKASIEAMRIFYHNNLMSHYPKALHWLILLGIKILEAQRVFKAKYL